MTRICYRLVLLLAVLMLLAACASKRPDIRMADSAIETNAQLSAVVEGYYAAETVEQMRQAVEDAQQLAPASAMYHDIAADLARMEDRYMEQFDHYVAALRDPGNDVADIHLDRLFDLNWTFAQWQMAQSLFETLADNHPLPSVQRRAAYYAMAAGKVLGRDEATLTHLRQKLGYRPPLAVIGTFDNDQGKGFDIPYPPEREISADKSYQGQILPVSWRTDAPTREYGDLLLGTLMHPNEWAVAYAAGAVEAKKEGNYELRLTTTDPAKIWVNDILVFNSRHIEDYRFDGVVIPVALRKGVNRILIKSAQKTGGWTLGLSITEVGGATPAADAFTQVPFDTAYAVSGPEPGPTMSAVEAVVLQSAATPPNTPRGMQMLFLRMEKAGLDLPSLKLAEGYVSKMPKSILPRYLLALSLWRNQERSRTADLLDELSAEVGDELLRIPIKMTWFQRQNNLKQKAREKLVAMCSAYPDRPTACLHLAQFFDGEDWTEDRLDLLKRLDARYPGILVVVENLAETYYQLNFDSQARAEEKRILAVLPNHEQATQRAYTEALKRDDLELAETIARKLLDFNPYYRSSWSRLGEVNRRQKDFSEAEIAYKHIIWLAPTSPLGYGKLAELYYQFDKTDEAIKYWKLDLDREPDNEWLANRLAFLSPPKRGPWAVDVPSEEDLAAAVMLRNSIEFDPSADVAYLLDHEVVELNPDGSSVHVVTAVAHALNEEGRDQLTSYGMRSGGRTRILHAYSVDPDGKVNEASSIRGRTIRFRRLEIGSTTVVQYRLDESPSAYLSGYYTSSWFYQNFKYQFVNSEFIIWAPKDDQVSQFTIGDVKHEQRDEGKLVRHAWSATNTPVLAPEPHSPSVLEFIWHLYMSTVPDWSMFQKWEKALLEDAFRTSPELIEVTNAVTKDAESVMDKLYAIQAYLEKDIRYQMDYEGTIAGVKPHAAPMVLARRYGDCKDKAVLFITMADLVGIEARFALVRTSTAGPIVREIPMQQFNHAIVYVPKQKGVEEGLFFDPTTDALDVRVLRHDDQGAWAFVLSSDKESYEWIQIPYQSPDKTFSKKVVEIRVNDDGSAEADIELTAQGYMATMVRKTARNREQFEQTMQQLTNMLIPSSRLSKLEPVQVESLMEPVVVRMKVDAATLARHEGRELRMTVPINWSPKEIVSLAERKRDLVLGIPQTLTWNETIKGPEGAKLKKMPQGRTVDAEYFTFTRSFTRSGKNAVVVNTEVVIKEYRVPVADYQKLRKDVETILRMLTEEVVFQLKK